MASEQSDPMRLSPPVLIVGAVLAAVTRRRHSFDFFQRTCDERPYALRPVDMRLFDPDDGLKPFDRRFDWSALAASPVMNDPDDMRRGYERPTDAR